MKKALLSLILLSVVSVNLMAQKQENELSDISYLNLLESPFGSIKVNAHNNGNEIICEKNSQNHCFGWILKDVDLSQYDKIRIEIGKNGLSGRLYLILEVNGKIYNYYHPAEQNIWEANLNGENASEILEDQGSEKGEVKIFFNTWNMGRLYQEEKFEVVSVQLLKGKYEPNTKYSLLGKDFGSCQDYVMIYSDGTVEWASARRQPYPLVGWDMQGIDLSPYKKIRIELESSEIKNRIVLRQNKKHFYIDEIEPNVFEANLDGSSICAITIPEKSEWDPSLPIEEIALCAVRPPKKGLKTKIKSITLIK